MGDHKRAVASTTPPPRLVRSLQTETRALTTRNTATATVAAVIVLAGVAALALALWAYFRTPANPVCVDPKLMTPAHARLQVRVLASATAPEAVNQCLTVMPGAAAADGNVVRAELGLAPCDVSNGNQAWTVNGMTVQGDVLNAATDGVETNLFSLSNGAGRQEEGATTSWRLASPCAMRSVDVACVGSAPCVARLTNNGAFNKFAPCAAATQAGDAPVVAMTPQAGDAATARPSTATARPSTAANRPLPQPPVTAATLHHPEPFFLLNNRTHDNWCGFHVRDHGANALAQYTGLQYDQALQRVVWGPEADLTLGFVSVDAEL